MNTMFPRFDEMPTQFLPATDGINISAIDAAIKLVHSRQAVRRFIEASRYAKRLQCELGRQETIVPVSTAETLKMALRRLFMVVVGYFHDHLESPMPVHVNNALHRLHEASHGGRVTSTALFTDLRQIGACEAICEPAVEQALAEAEQALLSMRIG